MMAGLVFLAGIIQPFARIAVVQRLGGFLAGLPQLIDPISRKAMLAGAFMEGVGIVAMTPAIVVNRFGQGDRVALFGMCSRLARRSSGLPRRTCDQGGVGQSRVTERVPRPAVYSPEGPALSLPRPYRCAVCQNGVYATLGELSAPATFTTSRNATGGARVTDRIGEISSRYDLKSDQSRFAPKDAAENNDVCAEEE
jgi:hypothetical protein